jgi:hypothetical protein
VIITMFFETLAPASKRALTVSTDEWTPMRVSAKMARCKGGSTESRFFDEEIIREIMSWKTYNEFADATFAGK